MRRAWDVARSRSARAHVGLVGLPNVGKSTLFNALTRSARAQVANFPFCTIAPNAGTALLLPDARLAALARTSASARAVPAGCEVVDIAGIVRGAAQGAGLGNKFLAHIREASALLHLVRCFDAPGIAHVDGAPDPVRDLGTVLAELLLADADALDAALDATHRRLARAPAGASGPLEKDLRARADVAERARRLIHAGRPAGELELRPAEVPAFDALHLLTAKPVVVVAAVEPEEIASAGGPLVQALEANLRELFGGRDVPVQRLCPKLELEHSALLAANDPASAKDLLDLFGIGSQIPGLFEKAMRALGRHLYYTSGPEETRAWNIAVGSSAAVAAAAIHSDFAARLIRAEVISCDDFVAHGGEAGAKAAGKLRVESPDYVVGDGEVLHFRLRGGK